MANVRFTDVHDSSSAVANGRLPGQKVGSLIEKNLKCHFSASLHGEQISIKHPLGSVVKKRRCP
jgi:hypothetical protein